MNLLICSKLSIPDKDRTLPAWQYLREMGHNVWVEHPKDCPGRPDAIISMGVTIMEETFEAIAKYPNTPLYPFNWDCYAWVWTAPRDGEYDYKRYGELLKKATEVWTPSECTSRRNEQWWGIKNNHVILSACPWWESSNIRDEGYALCTLRHLPDPWDTEFEVACADVGVPYLRPNHALSRPDYENVVAGCRFMVNHYFEASTGGLTSLEAYYLGKPTLASDSEWNGARDYFGDRASYFRFGDKQHFRQMLREMYENPPKLPADHKSWIEDNFSDERMVDDMLKRVKKYAHT